MDTKSPFALTLTIFAPSLPFKTLSYLPSMPSFPTKAEVSYPFASYSAFSLADIFPIYPNIWEPKLSFGYTLLLSDVTSTPFSSSPASSISITVFEETSFAIVAGMYF